MATVSIQHAGIQESLDGPAALAFLADHGVRYEYWDVSLADRALRDRATLTDAEKSALIAPFMSSLNRLAHDYGYISHDLIVLNREATANLDELLVNFQREHHHLEDEVRFILAGEGVFTLTRDGDTFSVLVTPGDLISVPAKTRHWFTLTHRLNVKAIRLFQTEGGWQAIYEAEGTLTS
ncbi:MAG: cupin domain-containing protein [Firmicutes bacterium]|jgi:1,2-dihydroxy-3-keto-5-methylthiopentene dioxygenase|nr:cupin domain-containing protein [Bacillota bacterium]